MLSEPVVQEGRCGGVEWAVCAAPCRGEMRSGDAFLVQQTARGVLVGVIDGLGHGDEAAAVAERAVASLRTTAEHSLMCSFVGCHAALRGSRGVVMTLATLDPLRFVLTWAAVGNVDAAVLRPGGAPGSVDRWSVPLRGGVLGDRLPVLRESTVRLAPSDTFVAATDGVSPAFLDAVDLSLEVRPLARGLHAGYATGDDDSLVLVARCGPC